MHPAEPSMTRTTRDDLCREVSARLGIRKYEAKATLEGFLAVLTRILARGDRAELRGFATFSTRTRRPRGNVRNPRTGDPSRGLPRRRIVRFKPAPDLKRGMAC